MTETLEKPPEPAVIPLRFTSEDLRTWAWEKVSPLLARACEHSGGRFLPRHIISRLDTGDFQLWGVARGLELLCVCVTTLHKYPTGLRTAEVVLLGGERKDAILPFLKVLSTFAAENNCDRLEFFGRRGFERELPECRQVGALFEMDI